MSIDVPKASFTRLEREYNEISKLAARIFALLIVVWILIIVFFDVSKLRELVTGEESETEVGHIASKLTDELNRFREYSFLVQRAIGPQVALGTSSDFTDKARETLYDLAFFQLRLEALYVQVLATQRALDAVEQELKELEPAKDSAKMSDISALTDEIRQQAEKKSLDSLDSLEAFDKESDQLKKEVENFRNYLSMLFRSHPESDAGILVGANTLSKELANFTSAQYVFRKESPGNERPTESSFEAKLEAIAPKLNSMISDSRNRNAGQLPSSWTIPYPGETNAFVSVSSSLDDVEENLNKAQARMSTKLTSQLYDIFIGLLVSIVTLIATKMSLNLYRYSTKMEAFYFGRSHLFNLYRHCRMQDGDYQLTASEVFELLKPETIEFGTGESNLPTKKGLRVLEALGNFTRR